MTDRHAFLQELGALYAAAETSVVNERPWFSLGQSGVHIRISMTCPEKIRPEAFSRLSTALLAHEFRLDRRFVADIAVRADNADDHRLVIDALLLDQ